MSASTMELRFGLAVEYRLAGHIIQPQTLARPGRVRRIAGCLAEPDVRLHMVGCRWARADSGRPRGCWVGSPPPLSLANASTAPAMTRRRVERGPGLGQGFGDARHRHQPAGSEVRLQVVAAPVRREGRAARVVWLGVRRPVPGHLSRPRHGVMRTSAHRRRERLMPPARTQGSRTASPKPMCKKHLPEPSKGVTCRCSPRGPDGLEGATLTHRPVKGGGSTQTTLGRLIEARTGLHGSARHRECPCQGGQGNSRPPFLQVSSVQCWAPST